MIANVNIKEFNQLYFLKTSLFTKTVSYFAICGSNYHRCKLHW